ncbi:MAG: flagellar hook-basal body complex protein [Bacillota bacterium]
MIRSLYSGVSGIRTHQIRMDALASNIANVNTTGYKAGRANFQEVLAQTLGRAVVNSTQVGLGVGLAAIDNVFTQGAMQTTGRSLDMAIEGNGFFVVKPVDTAGTTVENPMYTRDGTFYIDKDGYLVNTQGYRVQTSDGADLQFTTITPDQIATISVGTDGFITATGSDGTTETYTIGLCTFNNVESLQRMGSNLWDITAGVTQWSGGGDDPSPGQPGLEGRGIIRSGYLEMSNVDLAQEFTSMITTERGYQANARVITTSDEMLRELIDLKR